MKIRNKKTVRINMLFKEKTFLRYGEKGFLCLYFTYTKIRNHPHL